MKYPLTYEQKRCLELIKSLTERHGFAPSINELAHGLDLASKSGVHRLLASLKERGHVDWIPGRARSVVILAPSDPYSTEALSKLSADTLGKLISDAIKVWDVVETAERERAA